MLFGMLAGSYYAGDEASTSQSRRAGCLLVRNADQFGTCFNIYCSSTIRRLTGTSFCKFRHTKGTAERCHGHRGPRLAVGSLSRPHIYKVMSALMLFTSLQYSPYCKTRQHCQQYWTLPRLLRQRKRAIHVPTPPPPPTRQDCNLTIVACDLDASKTYSSTLEVTRGIRAYCCVAMPRDSETRRMMVALCSCAALGVKEGHSDCRNIVLVHPNDPWNRVRLMHLQSSPLIWFMTCAQIVREVDTQGCFVRVW